MEHGVKRLCSCPPACSPVHHRDGHFMLLDMHITKGMGWTVNFQSDKLRGGGSRAGLPSSIKDLGGQVAAFSHQQIQSHSFLL